MISTIKFDLIDYAMFFNKPSPPQTKNLAKKRFYAHFDNVNRNDCSIQSFFTDQPYASLNFGITLKSPLSAANKPRHAAKVHVNLLQNFYDVKRDPFEKFEQKIYGWMDYHKTINSMDELEKMMVAGFKDENPFFDLKASKEKFNTVDYPFLAKKLCEESEERYEMRIDACNEIYVAKNTAKALKNVENNYFSILAEKLGDVNNHKRVCFFVDDTNVTQFDNNPFNLGLLLFLLRKDVICLKVNVCDVFCFKKHDFFLKFLQGELGLRFEKIDDIVNEKNCFENLQFKINMKKTRLFDNKDPFTSNMDAIAETASHILLTNFSSDAFKVMESLKFLNETVSNADSIKNVPGGLEDVNAYVSELFFKGSRRSPVKKTDTEYLLFASQVFKNQKRNNNEMFALANQFDMSKELLESLNSANSWAASTGSSPIKTAHRFSFFYEKSREKRSEIFMLPIYALPKTTFSFVIHQADAPVKIYSSGGNFSMLSSRQMSMDDVKPPVKTATFFGGLIFVEVLNQVLTQNSDKNSEQNSDQNSDSKGEKENAEAGFLDIEFMDIYQANHFDFNSNNLFSVFKRKSIRDSHFLFLSHGQWTCAIPTNNIFFSNSFGSFSFTRSNLKKIFKKISPRSSRGLCNVLVEDSNSALFEKKRVNGVTYFNTSKKIAAFDDLAEIIEEAVKKGGEEGDLPVSAVASCSAKKCEICGHDLFSDIADLINNINTL